MIIPLQEGSTSMPYAFLPLQAASSLLRLLAISTRHV